MDVLPSGLFSSFDDAHLILDMKNMIQTFESFSIFGDFKDASKKRKSAVEHCEIPFFQLLPLVLP